MRKLQMKKTKLKFWLMIQIILKMTPIELLLEKLV
jgi:hypothetical protein